MSETHSISGVTFTNVHHGDSHPPGEHCVFHNPLANHMSEWQLSWRDDRGIFERICPEHGVGHPDPSQFDYWSRTNQEWQSVHLCCGCCAPKPQNVHKEVRND